MDRKNKGIDVVKEGKNEQSITGNSARVQSRKGHEQ